jgi:hypothetical protein
MGFFCKPRHFKYIAAAPRRKCNFDFEIPRDTSTRCKPIYAQADRPATTHFGHVTGAYL